MHRDEPIEDRNLAALRPLPAPRAVKAGLPLTDLQHRQMLEIGQRKRTGKRR